MVEISEEEAIWRLNEFAKAIHFIESQIEGVKGAVRMVEQTDLSVVRQWSIVHDYAKALKITIRKRPEKVTSYEQLTLKEIWSRVEFRSCHEGLCPHSHCTECGQCEARLGDSHDCNPPDLPE